MQRMGMDSFDDHGILWAKEIAQQSQESLALVIGVFDFQGELLYANAGMMSLLKEASTEQNAADVLINPDFSTLCAQAGTQGPVFQGLLTVGNRRNVNRTLKARVFCRNEQLLISGEYDVRELEILNQQMFALNQEITNMERALIKEKVSLQRTLEELRQTQAMLIHSEKMNALGKMVAGIVHEMNNPLAFVSSNLYSLQESVGEILDAYHQVERVIETNGSAKMREAAKQIRKACDLDFLEDDFADLYSASIEGVSRVQKLVQDLRSFSRLDESELKEVDLQESLQSTLTLVAPEIKKQQVEVRLMLEPLPRLQCYASELNQVFLNLVVNAIQAMGQGGRLEIRGREQQGEIVLEFADNGEGIAAENLENIFNPFFTTRPVGSGTGLGLSLAYNIITKNHHGTLTARSKPGEGAVFRITLPREQHT